MIVPTVALALLAGYGPSTSDSPQPAAPMSSPAASVDVNRRNNLTKALGQAAYTGCPLGGTDPAACTVEFRLDKVTACPAAGPTRRVLWSSVQTRPTFGADPAQAVYLSSADLRVIGSDQVSRPVSSEYRSCVADADRFPDAKAQQPSTRYVGGTEVMLPATTGKLVLAPPQNDGGWEWPLP